MELNIKWLNLNEDDTKKACEKATRFFKKVVNKDNSIEDYMHFDWDTLEKRHNENAKDTSLEDENDYYFRDGKEKYTLDISHDIESFGYNSHYYEKKYPERYENLYFCIVTIYRGYFGSEDKLYEVKFVYDRKADEIVDIEGVLRFGKIIDNDRNIRIITDEKVLKKCLELTHKSSQ